MKRFYFMISIVSVFLIMVACKPLVIETNDDYVGYWVGSQGGAYYEININSNSQATYEKVSGITTVNSSGKARLKGDKLKIGLKKFQVDQHPSSNSNNVWTMQLDGVTYTKY